MKFDFVVELVSVYIRKNWGNHYISDSLRFFWFEAEWLNSEFVFKKSSIQNLNDESVLQSAKLLIFDRSQCQRFHGLSECGQTSPRGRAREIFTFPRYPVEFHSFWHLPSVLDSNIKGVWQEYKMPQRQSLPIFQKRPRKKLKEGKGKTLDKINIVILLAEVWSSGLSQPCKCTETKQCPSVSSDKSKRPVIF